MDNSCDIPFKRGSIVFDPRMQMDAKVIYCDDYRGAYISHINRGWPTVYRKIYELKQKGNIMATRYYDVSALISLIETWAKDRNLIEGATRKDQLTKLIEEVGELAAGIARGDEIKIQDGIGDTFVVLTILALQSGITIDMCVNHAYNEIKDRKGKMVDGVFVKENE